MKDIIYTSLFMILAYTAYVDYKKKIIPNVSYVLVTVLGVIYIIVYKRSIVFTTSTILVMFFILLLVNFTSKSQLGMGDVKLLSLMGFFFSIYDIFNILFYSLILAAIVGGILIYTKKAERNTELPLIPFVLIGYIMFFLN